MDIASDALPVWIWALIVVGACAAGVGAGFIAGMVQGRRDILHAIPRMEAADEAITHLDGHAHVAILTEIRAGRRADAVRACRNRTELPARQSRDIVARLEHIQANGGRGGRPPFGG